MAKKEHKLWNEFKAFISRGNAFDMAVGVVIGGAFSAIVTALVNILMSLATWAVPGGINGLVTVLPALNPAQAGLELQAGETFQFFDKSMLKEYATYLGTQMGSSDPVKYGTDLITANYKLHGTTYVFNGSACIDWGAFINAVISFLIIAVTLFVVVKVVNTLRAARIAAEEKAKAAVAQEQPAEEAAEEEKPAE